MITKITLVSVPILVGSLLVACGPSQVELDATSTQIAVNIFATQTAEAPTPTATPTPTVTSTITPTPTITPRPLSDAILTLEDLPPGFKEEPLGEYNVEPGIGRGLVVATIESGFAFSIETEDFQAIIGQTELLTARTDQAQFDLFSQELSSVMIDVAAKLIGGEEAKEVEEIPDLDDIGEVSWGSTAIIGGVPPLRMEWVFFRRGSLGATIWTLYYDGDVPVIPISEVARILDARIIEVLGYAAPGTIKIGINAPLTGDAPKMGEGTKFAAEMWLEDIKAAGGLEVGGEMYNVELVIEDNEFIGSSAAAVNNKLITQDEVLVIVGPQFYRQAVPAGGVANDLETPMVSPWSTNPNTTLDRPWVFRATFLDTSQGPVVANFVSDEFGFTKAAVLYDVAIDYPKGLADNFKEGWEAIHGAGSVVAFESFTTGDTDFSAQITNIMDSGAEFFFAPQYDDAVPMIVQQAHELGFMAPIVGSDSWGSPYMVELCGADCYGLFFSTHYAAEDAVGATKEFIDRYNQKYGYVPDDVGALTWDTMLIVQRAIEDCGAITGDLGVDRACVRDALAGIKEFPGITGNITFTEEGDPIKCAVIAKISDDGLFSFYKQVCP